MAERSVADEIDSFERELTWGKLGGFYACIIGTGLIVAFCWSEGSMLFSLLALVGAVVGWLLGVLVVPYDEREARTFNVYIKVISGFITGYLLSKVDPLLGWLLAIDPTTGVAPISQELVAKRVLITVASFGISLLTVFSARAYWSNRQEVRAETDGQHAASGGVVHTKG